jgi:hypothetical protein
LRNNIYDKKGLVVSAVTRSCAKNTPGTAEILKVKNGMANTGILHQKEFSFDMTGFMS